MTGSRKDGTNSRALGTNPRALRTNPRALGRKRAKLSDPANRVYHRIETVDENGKVDRRLPKWLRFEVLKRCGFRCSYCGARPRDGALLQVDHIIPVSKGGDDSHENLTVACPDCNSGKSATPLGVRKL